MPSSIAKGKYAWLLVCWMGCGAPSSPPPEAPAPDTTQPDTTQPDTTQPDTTQPERQKLTSEQCAAQGGEVVGDIGDGATHRPDYLCPGGKPPTGNIAPPEGGPMPIEGAVCCPR